MQQCQSEQALFCRIHRHVRSVRDLGFKSMLVWVKNRSSWDDPAVTIGTRAFCTVRSEWSSLFYDDRTETRFSVRQTSCIGNRPYQQAGGADSSNRIGTAAEPRRDGVWTHSPVAENDTSSRPHQALEHVGYGCEI